MNDAPPLAYAEMVRILYRRRGAKGAAELMTGKLLAEDLAHLLEEAQRNLREGRPTPSCCCEPQATAAAIRNEGEPT